MVRRTTQFAGNLGGRLSLRPSHLSRLLPHCGHNPRPSSTGVVLETAAPFSAFSCLSVLNRSSRIDSAGLLVVVLARDCIEKRAYSADDIEYEYRQRLSTSTKAMIVNRS